jgi:hypothetical protein
MYKVGCITKSNFFFIFQLDPMLKRWPSVVVILDFRATPPPPPHSKNHPMIIHIQFGSIILLFLVKIIYYLAIKSFVRTLSCDGSHLEFPIGTTKFYLWSCIKEYSCNV